MSSSYSGPHQILSQTDKTLQILVRGKPITVSADRVKQAYILNGTNFNPPATATSAIALPATALYTNYPFWSPYPFPLSLQHLSNHLCRGECGNFPQCLTDNLHSVTKTGGTYTSYQTRLLPVHHHKR
jgi:hypothetical protein